MTAEDKIKRRHAIDRLISEVEEYYIKFQHPMPLRVVSAKFYRVFSQVGGYHAILAELLAEGHIVKALEMNGRAVIYPGRVISNIGA